MDMNNHVIMDVVSNIINPKPLCRTDMVSSGRLLTRKGIIFYS